MKNSREPSRSTIQPIYAWRDLFQITFGPLDQSCGVLQTAWF